MAGSKVRIVADMYVAISSMSDARIEFEESCLESEPPSKQLADSS